jgi:ABC-2 type transport system permease protein
MRAAPTYDVRAARGAPPDRPSPRFRTLVRLELSRTFRLKRPWIGLAVLGLIPVLITLSLDLRSRKPGQGDGPPFLFESLANGLFIPFATLEILIDILLPAVVALVAADALAGETASGTLRALLARPVTRTSVLLSKWVLSGIYAALGLLVMALTALAIGGLVFGIRDVNTVLYGVVTVQHGLGALGLAYLFGLVCMLGVIGIALTVSTLTGSPIGAFFGTVAVIAVENILKVLPSFEPIQPALITGHFATWRKVVQEPPDYEAYLRGLIVPSLYAVVGLAIAWWMFRRRDVLA